MQTHGPKRVYTPHSLEYWFDMLADDWSETFSASQLDEGRRIYRNGEVRELELTDRDAIIHRRIEKKDEYAVIEWNAGGLSVRSSTTDREIAHALAVAGLHEIEELVADEISPLPAEAPIRHANGNGHAVGNGAANGNGKSALRAHAARGPAVARLNGPVPAAPARLQDQVLRPRLPGLLGRGRPEDPPSRPGAGRARRTATATCRRASAPS